MGTKQQRDEVRAMVAEFSEILFLKDWDITLNFPKTDKDSDIEVVPAEITVTENYQSAEIDIYPCYFKRSLKKRRLDIAHELSHCLTQASLDIFDQMHEGKLVTPDTARAANERMTNKLATIIVQLQDRWHNEQAMVKLLQEQAKKL
ncbi:hypothetical protein KJ611_04060 [Patescibacteria group bacterium]|nr:hypothetical protein [Patescibacteria group bacterium]MBU1705625.1 hypothetical protein [Patescibacteria group bacterium]